MASTSKPSESQTWIFGPMQVAVVDGAANSLKVPSVSLLLALHPVQQEAVALAEKGLGGLCEELGLGVPDLASTADSSVRTEKLLREWLNLMLGALGQLHPLLNSKVAGAPLLQRRLVKDRPGTEMIILQWPTYWPDFLAPILTWSMKRWTALSHAGGEPSTAEMGVSDQVTWRKIEEAAKRFLPSGVNPARLLAAARTLNCPVHWLERELMQLGDGRRARWMRSTMTDVTSSIGVGIARDKVRTARLLRQAGLPVPQHIEVVDVDAAQAAAERLGWPVVVKPADRDRGNGARANLDTPEAVRAAFAHASAFSKRVLVEQHIQGHEYRLTIVNGELLWAHERLPASVTGDGQRSVQALIDAENVRRRQALLTDPDGWLPIQMDTANLSYLNESGRSLDDVPEAGEIVRLHRVPLSRTGGMGQSYFDTLHPDNRRLAERAAQILRLDIAGVDLIMPDITRSWREVGGAVTEVNAIPGVAMQTNPLLHQRLLQRIMPHSGRIPLLFVLAEGDKPQWIDGVITRLEAAGLHVGLTSTEGLQIGGNWIHGPRASAWDDIRAMQMDPSVGAIVIVSDGADLLRTGLPFDTVDALVVQSHQPQALSLLLPYARSVKLYQVNGRQKDGAQAPAMGKNWQTFADNPESIVALTETTVNALLQAEATYAQPL